MAPIVAPIANMQRAARKGWIAKLDTGGKTGTLSSLSASSCGHNSGELAPRPLIALARAPAPPPSVRAAMHHAVSPTISEPEKAPLSAAVNRSGCCMASAIVAHALSGTWSSNAPAELSSVSTFIAFLQPDTVHCSCFECLWSNQCFAAELIDRWFLTPINNAKLIEVPSQKDATSGEMRAMHDSYLPVPQPTVQRAVQIGLPRFLQHSSVPHHGSASRELIFFAQKYR